MGVVARISSRNQDIKLSAQTQETVGRVVNALGSMEGIVGTEAQARSNPELSAFHQALQEWKPEYQAASNKGKELAINDISGIYDLYNKSGMTREQWHRHLTSVAVDQVREINGIMAKGSPLVELANDVESIRAYEKASDRASSRKLLPRITRELRYSLLKRGPKKDLDQHYTELEERAKDLTGEWSGERTGTGGSILPTVINLSRSLTVLQAINSALDVARGDSAPGWDRKDHASEHGTAAAAIYMGWLSESGEGQMMIGKAFGIEQFKNRPPRIEDKKGLDVSEDPTEVLTGTLGQQMIKLFGQKASDLAERLKAGALPTEKDELRKTLAELSAANIMLHEEIGHVVSLHKDLLDYNTVKQLYSHLKEVNNAFDKLGNGVSGFKISVKEMGKLSEADRNAINQIVNVASVEMAADAAADAAVAVFESLTEDVRRNVVTFFGGNSDQAKALISELMETTRKLDALARVERNRNVPLTAYSIPDAPTPSVVVNVEEAPTAQLPQV